MCFSAEVVANHRKFANWTGINMPLKEFYELFYRRHKGAKIKVPKAMEAAFANPQTDEERRIKELIDGFNSAESTRLEQELFKQKKRLADAERTLATKTTKAATESQRIATDKIRWAMTKLDDIRRTDLKPRDARVFPGHYVPVLISEGGQLVVKPMRYQCRPAGKQANYDIKYPGTYNARRDNLEGFWKGQFGHHHGIMIVNAFFENVARHKAEHRELAPGEQEENVVLEFRPQPPQDMLIACLWSHWSGPGDDDLLSFAAITDEPPPEVAAAGHDRCIIQIKPENVQAWLNPDPKNLAALYRILDDRPTAIYEHRMAA
ncbi:MAG: SOS response-associated peptidase family protein [Acidobacteriota bacterium]